LLPLQGLLADYQDAESLMELVSVAEGAIAAINQRDRVTAALQKEREDTDKADSGG
jgi:potassium channel subfamily K